MAMRLIPTAFAIAVKITVSVAPVALLLISVNAATIAEFFISSPSSSAKARC
jgi:hypothetical protein